MSAKPGDRFRVSEIHEVKDRKGRIITKFLPDFDYRVSPRNLELVNKLVDELKIATVGTALPARGGAGFSLGASPARLAGAVRVGRERQEVTSSDVGVLPAKILKPAPRRRATPTKKA